MRKTLMRFLRFPSFSLFFTLLAATAFCDVIHLKSGRQISCESVVEEAAQVHCKIGRSTMGFPKAQIAKIEKSTAPAIKSPPPKQLSILPRVHNPADEIESMARAHRFTMEGAASMKALQ